MKSAALFLLVLVIAAAGGYVLRDRTTPATGAERSTKHAGKRMTAEQAPWIEEALKVHSGNTIDDLLENHTSTRLPRMTLWLIEASSDEIGELWRTLDERDDLDMRTYDLILIHWTEIDPRSAIAAAKESGHENAAWWAWGRAEPELALQTALREAPNHADSVLRAIGQFRVDRALQLMEKYPEALAHTSIEGIGSGLKRDDPEQAVAFLRARGQSGSKALKEWAERDPDNALAWARHNLRGDSGGEPGSDVDYLVSELVVEHPDRVKNWLKDLPTGGLRAALATEYIKHLADQDMDQALAFARAESGLKVRTGLMAALGQRLAFHDPDRSIALLRESTMELRKVPGSNDSMTGGSAVNEWREHLLGTHPEQVVNMAVELSNDPHHRYALAVMSNWMSRDEVAYAEWLIDQQPGEIRDNGAQALVNQLMGHNSSNYGTPPDFESALGWAAAINTETHMNRALRDVVRTWITKDPSGAETYYQNAPANAAGRELFERYQKP